MKLINTFILLISLGLASSKKTDDEIVPEVLPKFSLPSGFYDKKSIKLEIIKPDPDAVIYYTLDGSLPNESSTIYEKPFTLKNKSSEENVYSATKGVSIKYNFIPSVTVKKANIIRTMAKLPDGTFTDVVSGTYFVGLNRKKLYKDVPVISLITDPDNLFNYENGIYILGKTYDEWIKIPGNEKAASHDIKGNYSAKGKDAEIPVTFQLIPSNNKTVDFSQDLGFRIKGKASRNHNQKNFRFASRDKYGKKNVKYELIPGNMRSDGQGPVTKYKSFVIRNGGNDFVYAKIRDHVLQKLVMNNQFETQQSDLAVAYLDGEYWGLYYIYEEYDDDYIANNYDIDDKNVIMIKGTSNIEAGTEEDLIQYKNDIKFVQYNDMSIPANYTKASEILDIEGFGWFSAYQTFIECKDGFVYGGNYAMWRVKNPDSTVPKADGKLRFLLFDTEYSTGLYDNEKTKYDINVFPEMYNSTSKISQYYGPLLIKSLLKNEDFKKMYINNLCDVQNIIFDEKVVNKTIDKASSIVFPLIKDNTERFGLPVGMNELEDKPTPEEHLKNEVNHFKSWIANRRTVFLKFVADAFGLKPAVKISVTSNNFKKGGFSINNGYEFNGKIFDKKFEGDYFRENVVYITGHPVKGRKLSSWNVKKCKIASNKKSTLGIYPTKGCKVTANFK